MAVVFAAQIIIGLFIYGRGWWHGAFGKGDESEPNKTQLYITVRGYDVNLSAFGNVALGLALIVSGIAGLVLWT